MTDLIERLQDAAVSAIASRQAAISDKGDHLKSITVEIEIANGGDVLDVTSYLAWKKTVRRASR